MAKIDEILSFFIENEKSFSTDATFIGDCFNIDRTSASRYLNELTRLGKLSKNNSRPVIYSLSAKYDDNLYIENNEVTDSFQNLIGSDKSLLSSVEKAKAAILYPPKGLHSLIIGETGVGKSLFAENIYDFAKNSKVLSEDAPFVRFNCADYADNPSLLTAQIFGSKRGSYTGAVEDKDGLLKIANGGILFLDEVHRLSNHGQEMLFTYMDKGYFKPLGETKNKIQSDVRIITATNQDPSSVLLSTFYRRIPMVIELPNLDNRTLEERLSLIEFFFRNESNSVSMPIYITKDALISYLLYKCPNNIGQLKSDIQLACAKAFLRYKSLKEDNIMITLAELPNHVRKGLLNLSDNRNTIDFLLKPFDEIIYFDSKDFKYNTALDNINNDFYTTMENQATYLESKGLDSNEINNILNKNLDSSFKNYLSIIEKAYDNENINQFIDEDIRNLSNVIINMAKDYFNKTFSEKVYFALCFHLERSISRISKGLDIFNPKLDSIRGNYNKEFIFAMNIANIIDKEFNIITPLDEIGYLAMFFVEDVFSNEEEENTKVQVIALMHGKSTASSMAEVVNTLLPDSNVIGLDMNLNTKPKTFLDTVKQTILSCNYSKGVLLMVDMGSLTGFANILSDELKINIKAMDMVTTLNLMEVSRKSIMGYSLDDIYLSENPTITSTNDNINSKKFAIVSSCFTGDGASAKVSEIISSKLGSSQIYLKNVSSINKIDFLNSIDNIKKNYNIIALISTTSQSIDGVFSISTIDFLKNVDNYISVFKKDISFIESISKSLNEQIRNFNIIEYLILLFDFIHSWELKFNKEVDQDIRLGIMMHLIFLLDKSMSETTPTIKSPIVSEDEEILFIRDKFLLIENKYNICFSLEQFENLKKILNQE